MEKHFEEKKKIPNLRWIEKIIINVQTIKDVAWREDKIV